MIEPQKMVITSIIASIISLLVIFIYFKFYKKKEINYLFLLIIISIPPIVNIFRPGTYESGDFNIHLYRTIEFYNSLNDGQILPSWAGMLNATYGYPLFIFNYPLPYYLISFFHFLGFSFIASMKLFLAANFVLSGIFMYIFTKNLFKNNLAAFTSSIFYLFAPYHLIDLHFKIVIGEILTFTLIPLTFFFFQKIWEEKNKLWIALASISIALLIMSHVVLALFSMILLFSYAIFLSIKSKKKNYIIATLIPFILGSTSSIYIWLTPFFMSQYTILKQVNDFAYFPQIWELLFSPWRMGFLFQGHKGELSFLLGYTHIAIFFALLFLLGSHKITNKYKKQLIFWLSSLSIFIFLITPYSKFIWGTFPFLKITGSHRLILITTFISSILAGYLILQIQKKKTLIFGIIVITVLSTILNWGHRRVIPEINDQQLINNVWKSTSTGEGHFYANSQYRNSENPWFTELPHNEIDIIKGTGEIKKLKKNSVEHIYIISAKTFITLRENTLYFPGWNIYNNEKLIPISHDKEGIITFTLPKGLHYIEVKYHDLFIYKLLKIISSVMLLTLTVYLLINFIRKLKFF